MQQVIMLKRRTLYEEKIGNDPFDYDGWFDYLRLEEENGDTDIIREVYERAIANIPPAEEKRLWRRYIYLWIYYAVFEELVVGDIERSRAVYKAAIDLVPHRQFTFAKLWTLFARFNLRHSGVTSARKTFGAALGLAAKPKIYKDYIEMEMQLREFDRCRIIYEKFLEYDPTNATTWLRYAELERLLLDDERAHAIYELAIEQPVDMPELVWKSYIDYEYESDNYNGARDLYERLLQKTEHLKVWVSFANFETSVPSADAMDRARAVLQRAYDSLKEQDLTTERILLLEAWKDLELRNDPDANLDTLLARFPRTVPNRRETDEGWEEYTEYIFPEDEIKQPAGKLLAIAHKWKKAKTEEGSNE
jgi:crooked neck